MLFTMCETYVDHNPKPIPTAPVVDSKVNVSEKWNAVYDAYNEVACLMLVSMTPELHKQFENYSPYDMLQELKSIFKKQARVERFDLIQTFQACKQEEGKKDISVGLILNGFTSDFAGFVRNYNMHNMGKKIGEIHARLIEYEKGLPKKAKTSQVMMIKSGKIQKTNKKSLKAKDKGKANGKGKDKQVYIPNPKNPKPSAKENQLRMTPATTIRKPILKNLYTLGGEYKKRNEFWLKFKKTAALIFTLENLYPMDDEPMWAADRVIALTPGFAITIPETANEFAIKGNHLTLVKGNQFDGRTKTDPHKHIYEFLRIFDMFKYRDTENEATWLDKLNEGTIETWDELRTAFISRFFPQLFLTDSSEKSKLSLNMKMNP
nr:hypothetical protein [Tanacetum cinerariifolium]